MFLYYLIGINLLTLIVYGIDKGLAKTKFSRIPESTLLGLGFFGGWFGAFLGMQLWRHKTRKQKFWLSNAGFALLWLAGFGAYFYLKS